MLDAALATFARRGYRKTSMDDIARDARISRPGLYFLFESKPALFRDAATRALGRDLAAAEDALSDDALAPAARLVAAFDCWAGRYLGPLSDVSTMLESNPELLGPVPGEARARFERLVVRAVADGGDGDGAEAGAGEPADVRARLLIDASVGLKHRVRSRDEYLAGMSAAVRIIALMPR